MSPGEPPRDWDKELAAIDKLIASGAGSAPPASPAVKGKGAAPAPVRTDGPTVAPSGGRKAALLTWFRVVLGVLLAVALMQWPYDRSCGLPLFGYLGGIAALLAVSLSGMVSAWRTRSALAHTLSLSLLLFGAGLTAREVLPRIGYAKRSVAWVCETRPAQPVQRPAPPQAAPATPSTPQTRDSF